jgi:hypothetical protein
MGAHRQGAQYTAKGVYNNTHMDIKVGVNAQNNFCVNFLVFHATSIVKRQWRHQTMQKDRTLRVQNKAPIRSLAAGSALPR